MRKVSWVAMGCIAAYVAQAIIAADSTRAVSAKDPTSGRSRLLIFSRSKDKVQNEDEEAAPQEGAARARVSPTPNEQPPRTAARMGDTGTVSGRAVQSRSAAAKPGSAKLPAASTQDLAPSEDDDELLRKLFESDEFDPAPAKPAANRPAAGRAEMTSRNSVQEADSADVNFGPQSRAASPAKSDRYRELLEPTASNKTQANKSSSSRAPRSTNGAVRQASGSGDKLELEINPFEADERPSKVINARFDSEGPGRRKNEVQPVSASATQSLIVKPKAGAAATTRTAVLKKAEASKTAPKTSTPAVAQPAVTATRPTTPTTFSDTSHSPQVDVQWEAKGEVTLGQECQCSLIVQNNSKIPCRDLVVEANFPESVRLVDASPFPKSPSGKLEWQFATLAAGEKKVIDLTMVPTKAGELAASAQVRFTGTSATSFNVSEPKLAAELKVASEVRIGDPASATVTVSNPGTGTAQNVILKASLPAGLECKTGKEFIAEIGPVGPGESRVVRLGLIAAAGGDHSLKVVAHSSTTDLEASAQASVKVLAPSLSLSATGPSLRYHNRAAKYVLTAANNSNAACDNVRLTQVVDQGFDFIKADHGGRWDAQRRTISWFIGHMDPGQTQTVDVELMPKETGEFEHQFRVTGDAGIEATSVVTTRVDGAASLVMDVKDTEDPIEVGSDMVYTIRVRNDGSKSAGKVAISCELPPDVELVNAEGPSQHIVESGMLIFKPVTEIAAGDSVTYKVKVKATVAGTMKLRARLTSEAIQKPLIVEEATQFYGE